jgi:hypothetical protein
MIGQLGRNPFAEPKLGDSWNIFFVDVKGTKGTKKWNKKASNIEGYDVLLRVN